MFPESYYCETHGRKHKKGSSVYYACLKESASAGVEEDEILFRLKPSSPGSVIVRTGSFDKTFSRTMEPFIEKVVIFERVLEPTGFFSRG